LSRKFRFALVALAVTALGVGVAVAASHHTVKIDSKVTITKTSPVFAGKVKSSDSGCKPGRIVSLHVVEMDNDVIGTDKTGPRGKWRIQFQGEGEAHYYASVSRRVEGAAGTTYICRHDTSPPIQAP
jgi:hypothetical protein